mmetsp:Transcript_9400/g.27395  ORF Transcript_9400/g.27395 Transcript_9400/m.27395 type:complete len:237 (+) Transcript_9400:352-1062(+)
MACFRASSSCVWIIRVLVSLTACASTSPRARASSGCSHCTFSSAYSTTTRRKQPYAPSSPRLSSFITGRACPLERGPSLGTRQGCTPTIGSSLSSALHTAWDRMALMRPRQLRSRPMTSCPRIRTRTSSVCSIRIRSSRASSLCWMRGMSGWVSSTTPGSLPRSAQTMTGTRRPRTASLANPRSRATCAMQRPRARAMGYRGSKRTPLCPGSLGFWDAVLSWPSQRRHAFALIPWG